MAKIRCPKCNRTLGDTTKSIDAMINCKSCKQAVAVRIKFTNTDYFKKGEK